MARELLFILLTTPLYPLPDVILRIDMAIYPVDRPWLPALSEQGGYDREKTVDIS
jgi:hypothetical protein